MSLEWRQAVSANCGSKNSWFCPKINKAVGSKFTFIHVKCIYIPRQPWTFAAQLSPFSGRYCGVASFRPRHTNASAQKDDERGTRTHNPDGRLGIIICKLPYDIISFLRVYNSGIATQMECRLWKVFLRLSPPPPRKTYSVSIDAASPLALTLPLLISSAHARWYFNIWNVLVSKRKIQGASEIS